MRGGDEEQSWRFDVAQSDGGTEVILNETHREAMGHPAFRLRSTRLTGGVIPKEAYREAVGRPA